jgi:hypothetical protein
MSEERRYASPQAFRQALTDRLSAAAEQSRWSLPELQRQFAYDRLLARLYATDRSWVLKGAAALIARGIAVRSTIDIDIYRAHPVAESEKELRAAAQRDLGDWFDFALGPRQPVNDGVGVRIPVTASIGASEWTAFHVDLVGADLRMTGQPDEMEPLAIVSMPDVGRERYVVYPLVDHIADKCCAILERHGPMERPSTRYKDLVDLVAIISTSPVSADAAMNALKSEAARRGLQLPRRFDVPDRELWERGYQAEASRSLLTSARTLGEALVLSRWFVDPLLDETAGGVWEPANQKWSGLPAGRD